VFVCVCVCLTVCSWLEDSVYVMNHVKYIGRAFFVAARLNTAQLSSRGFIADRQER
jgi:hypothetical protein